MDKRTILVWFRNDLRIHDNEILLRAVERSHQIIPVYCFDPRYFVAAEYGTKKTGVLRAAFLRENVLALKHALQQLGGDLIIAYGHPEVLLPQIAAKYHVNEVYHHREVAHEETHISALVEEALWKMQINLRHFIGHTLYHKEDLPFPIKDIPDAFSIFKKKTERESAIRPQLGSPDTIHIPEEMETGDLPSLTELGFSEAEIEQIRNMRFQGGETAALKQMGAFLQGHPSTMDYSSLSPYIAIGSLSPNTLYHAVKEAEQVTLDKKRVEQIILKLLWRDYYRFMFKKHGNRFFHSGGLTDTPPDTHADDDANFDKWKTGNSGSSIVDKGMRQLNKTGHIPHHLRVIVAAYLIHELGVSWLKGAAWFEEKLIDYGPSTNYGSWAHLAGVGSSGKDNKPIDIKKISAQFYPKEAMAF
ncbi:DASH family cryptochrome [Parapedobacter tibetensis]|uniref:DASH family cryptochrome n=1 Tax=Parapedobacter tibetensis TaxID=2972951 RepID=UPI00214D4D6F|nr:DASH family cryptochrome [Parapedobacter tibetensis]